MIGFSNVSSASGIALIASILVVGASHPARAQKSPPKRAAAASRSLPSNADPAPTLSTAQLAELSDTVALLPWTYRNGKEAAVQSARGVCNELLLETGFNVFLVKSFTGRMPPAMPNNGVKKDGSPFANLLDDGRALIGQTITGEPGTSYVLPTTAEMEAIGEKLRTRYVLAGRAHWSTRNVWVGISNRAKSMCTVDLLILDMESRRLVLEARNVQGDSTETKNMLNTVTSVVSLNPLPLILPGSVTPQEQRAVSVATAKAMEPWLRKQRKAAALQQADLSANASADSRTKFSSLVTPVSRLQATLHVTVDDAKQLSALDSDMARVFAQRMVNLDYTEPTRLRLQAMSPKSGPVALLFDEDTRRMSVGEGSKGSSQDVSNAPTRRLSLLDFCGLLEPNMFDYTRARFVRPDKVDTVPTVVYDLSYWRADTTSFQRVWIDPARNIVLRREIYDKNSKLKAVFLYQQMAQAAPNTWLPGRLEIQSPSRSRIALVTITDARLVPDTPSDRSTQSAAE